MKNFNLIIFLFVFLQSFQSKAEIVDNSEIGAMAFYRRQIILDGNMLSVCNKNWRAIINSADRYVGVCSIPFFSTSLNDEIQVSKYSKKYEYQEEIVYNGVKMKVGAQIDNDELRLYAMDYPTKDLPFTDFESYFKNYLIKQNFRIEVFVYKLDTPDPSVPNITSTRYDDAVVVETDYAVDWALCKENWKETEYLRSCRIPFFSYPQSGYEVSDTFLIEKLQYGDFSSYAIVSLRDGFINIQVDKHNDLPSNFEFYENDLRRIVNESSQGLKSVDFFAKKDLADNLRSLNHKTIGTPFLGALTFAINKQECLSNLEKQEDPETETIVGTCEMIHERPFPAVYWRLYSDYVLTEYKNSKGQEVYLDVGYYDNYPSFEIYYEITPSGNLSFDMIWEEILQGVGGKEKFKKYFLFYKPQ